ncbi:MAG: class I SAM-dependent methyltransferase [Thaumarchaeota archaeon]|nr:class I SAM-dependent methyltransferase [Nitrososphaerota archaeon]
MPTKMKQPDYGIDAPRFDLTMFLLGAVTLASGLAVTLSSGLPGSELVTAVGLDLTGIGLLFVGVVYVYSSKVGKLRLREKVVGMIPWKGDEKVLDIGCGRGLLLIGAARHLVTGSAVGVDIWKWGDLTGNAPGAALENAKLEGVADRVTLKEGDASSLAFPDSTFDVVLSSLAIHNLKGEEARDRAIREAVRVLKPGGTLAIYDWGARRYSKVLTREGMTNVRLHEPIPLFLFFGRIVTARKPSSLSNV